MSSKLASIHTSIDGTELTPGTPGKLRDCKGGLDLVRKAYGQHHETIVGYSNGKPYKTSFTPEILVNLPCEFKVRNLDNGNVYRFWIEESK